VYRHDDALRALEASHEKRFFGSKVTVSVHEGLGKLIIIIIIIIIITVQSSGECCSQLTGTLYVQYKTQHDDRPVFRAVSK